MIINAKIMVVPRTPCADFSLLVQIKAKNKPRLGNIDKDKSFERFL